MAITQESVDALEKALSSGALSVDHPDIGHVTYRSIVDLIRAIAYAKEQLAGSSSSATSQSFASFSKD